MPVMRLTCPSCEAKLKLSGEAGEGRSAARGLRQVDPRPRARRTTSAIVDEERRRTRPEEARDGITAKAGGQTADASPPGRARTRRPEDDHDPDEDEPAPKKRATASRRRPARPALPRHAPPAGRDGDEDPDEDEEERAMRVARRGRRIEEKGSPVLLWAGLGGWRAVAAVGRGRGRPGAAAAEQGQGSGQGAAGAAGAGRRAGGAAQAQGSMPRRRTCSAPSRTR